ncbi:MAG: hypothetical protein AAF693_16830 [Bacteroidota bacterium]
MTQELQIPFYQKIDQPNWYRIDGYGFISKTDTLWDVSGQFNDSDLSGEVKMAWNHEGLHFHINWQDDTVDTKFLPLSASTIQSPSGRRMDAMYLFDNLKIQLRTNELNYSCWLAPAENSLQWHLLRVNKSKVDAPKPSITNHTSENGMVMTVKIDWADLGIEPKKSDQFNLIIVLNDVDQPGSSTQERINSNRKYITLSKNIILL